MFTALTGGFFAEGGTQEKKNDTAGIVSKTRRWLVVNAHKCRNLPVDSNLKMETKIAVVIQGHGYVGSEVASGLNLEWESEFMVDIGLDNFGLRKDSFFVCIVDLAMEPIACSQVYFRDIMENQPHVLKGHWRPLVPCPADVSAALKTSLKV
jgi:hypothetical protein